MKKAMVTIIVTLFLASMLSMAFNITPVAAESTLIWQIGELEPSASDFSLTEQVDEFWPVNVNIEFTFTVDPTIVVQDLVDNPFPRGITSTGKVNIVFDVAMTGTFMLRYSRFGSETNDMYVDIPDDILVDGTLVASITGFGDGPGTDFRSLISFDLDTVGTHTLSIVTYGGDTGAHWFEALALEHVTVWDLPHFDLNFVTGEGGYDDTGKYIKISVKVPETGLFTIHYLRDSVLLNHPGFGLADLDATDGEATVYIPIMPAYHLYIFARGKPGGSMECQYLQHWERATKGGKPNVYKDGFVHQPIDIWYENFGLKCLSIRWYSVDLGVPTVPSR